MGQSEWIDQPFLYVLRLKTDEQVPRAFLELWLLTEDLTPPTMISMLLQSFSQPKVRTRREALVERWEHYPYLLYPEAGIRRSLPALQLSTCVVRHVCLSS
jgi:hypothetical protein